MPHETFEIVNDGGPAEALIICDHASAAIPADLNGLGVDAADLRRHIAWDIGAADVARRLSAALGAVAVLCGTSRLVIDCNRHLDDPSSIPERSDGIEVPGNLGLSETERRHRADRYFRPYHEAIERRLAAFREAGALPLVISVHSFTPHMNGDPRPWQVGILWDRFPQPARAIIAHLREHQGLTVGANEPYSGQDTEGYGVKVYGSAHRLPMAMFEIRQDLVADAAGWRDWAGRLERAVRPLIDDPELRRRAIA